VKIRWIAQSWAGFGDGWESYMEPTAGNPFDLATSDDGWWIDEIQITGAITTPVNPVVDPTTIPLTTQCPSTEDANCDQTQGTNGFNIIFTISDTDQDTAIAPGEEILLDASQTTNPGGCADGVPQFQFSRMNGATTTILQSWSTAASLKLSNEAPGDAFKVEVRCSSDGNPGHCSVTTGTSCRQTSDCPGGETCVSLGCITTASSQTGGAGVVGPCQLPSEAFAPAASGNATQTAGFTNWLFGLACNMAGAGAAVNTNICAQTHSFLHGDDPNKNTQVGFRMLPEQWGNVYISTGALPVNAAPAGCAVGDFGMCAATPWARIANAVCGGTGGLAGYPSPATNLLSFPYRYSANSCDVSPGNWGWPFAKRLPTNVCPSGFAPQDMACGDAAPPPAVNTVIYYLAGYHSVGAPGGGCGTISPALPANSAVFVPNFVYANGRKPDCYRIDDDASLGPGTGAGTCVAPSTNIGDPCTNPNNVGCLGGPCNSNAFYPPINLGAGCQ
jgi:hypothetical protein